MARKHDRVKKARVVVYDTGRVEARLILLPVLALLLTLIVECLSRDGSLSRLWQFMSQKLLYFFYNVLIVITTLIFSELFKRRRAMLVTISVLWVALGIIQYLVVKYRTQPFCSVDILMLKDAFSLITVYFSWPQIIMMFAAGFLLVFLVVMLFARMKRRERFNFPMSVVTFCGFVLTCFCVCALGMRYGLFPQRFDNLVDAYNDYGFATCFTFTFGQQGISRPNEYSTERVAEILEDIDDESEDLTYPVFDEKDNLARPNIIFLQLESFFDVNTIIGGEYSRDPTPNFNRLSANCPSGELYVPTIGGGTANTEFEVLSGLNLDFFGAGEYPYNTILQEKPCETICYNLKDYNYVSTALHNNTGTFYSRNEVYARLGFDRFVSLEYMQDVSYTSLGWCEDGVLTDEIIRALESTVDRDLLFTITVESHGKYAETYEPKAGDVEVLSLPEGIPLAPFQNFVNILTATDEFLGTLVRQLSHFQEPTILVVYGDHLPALELENDMLTTGNIYASRYVIWNNFGASLEAPDLQAYRLGANLFKQLGFNNGVINKYHQAAEPDDTSEEYLNKLELLEYDLLYGDQEAYGGEFPYVETELMMGSVPITIEDASLEYGRLLVTGKNFTEYSNIVVNDQLLETAYIDSEHIIAIIDDQANFDSFCVAQVNRDGVSLSRTDAFELPEEE